MTETCESWVLYEDDNIEVFFSKSESEYLLITFSNLPFRHNGSDFYARVPCMKKKISVIGVVAKKKNWYPAQSMIAASAVINEISRCFDLVASHGGSMGGYAAIKFSKLLAVTHIIAFCPQWSINKKECDGMDPGWTEHFTEDMSDMSIKNGEVDGKLFIFYDKKYARDRFHAEKIKEISPEVHEIFVPRVGHKVTPVYLGSDLISSLMESCVYENFGEIHKINKAAYRKFPEWKASFFQDAKRRHPALLAKLAKNRENIFESYFKDNLFWLKAQIEVSEGEEGVINYFVEKSYTPEEFGGKLVLLKYFAMEYGKRLMLLTCRNNILAYDILLGEIRSVSLPMQTHEKFLEIEMVDDEVLLYFHLGTEKIRIFYDESRVVRVGQSFKYTRLNLVVNEGNIFGVKGGWGFLGTGGSGAVSLSRPSQGSWEKFQFTLI